MSKVLIIEADKKNREDIVNAVLLASPTHEVQSFANQIDFEASQNLQIELDKKEPPPFTLAILDYNLYPQNQWSEKLIQIKDLIKNPDCLICFTAYEKIELNRKFIITLDILNIFYKPFDPLILKETINLTLNSKKRTSLVEMKTQIMKGQVGILKEIRLVSICELGFVTLSDVPIKQNSFSKYYSALFSRDKKQSTWAQCLLSLPIPNKPNTFINKFQFVNLEQKTLHQIRSYIQNHKNNKASNSVWDLTDSPEITNINIGIFENEIDSESNLKRQIQEHFTNVRLQVLHPDLTKDTPDKYKHLDAIINFLPELNIETYKELFRPEIPFFLILEQNLEDETLKQIQSNYRDIFAPPLDASYFYKKLKLFLHAARLKDPMSLVNINSQERMKAANLVNLSEICELYLNFNYHRELGFGEFREFAFINEDEHQIIELPAYCNNVVEEKDCYNHQFIFWGMTDYYLKEIRIWILKNYIQINKK